MTMERLRLSEYESRRARFSQSQAERLNDTGFVSVVPDTETGWWKLTTGHHVGTLVVGDTHISVRPKIRLENLFLLLAVGLKETDWGRVASRYATHNDLLPAVVSFFTRQVDLTIGRGVYRSYQGKRERLSTIRGAGSTSPPS